MTNIISEFHPFRIFKLLCIYRVVQKSSTLVLILR